MSKKFSLTLSALVLDPTWTAARGDGMFTMTPIRVIRTGAGWGNVFSHFMTNVSFFPHRNAGTRPAPSAWRSTDGIERFEGDSTQVEPYWSSGGLRPWDVGCLYDRQWLHTREGSPRQVHAGRPPCQRRQFVPTFAADKIKVWSKYV